MARFGCLLILITLLITNFDKSVLAEAISEGDHFGRPQQEETADPEPKPKMRPGIGTINRIPSGPRCHELFSNAHAEGHVGYAKYIHKSNNENRACAAPNSASAHVRFGSTTDIEAPPSDVFYAPLC